MILPKDSVFIAYIDNKPVYCVTQQDLIVKYYNKHNSLAKEENYLCWDGNVRQVTSTSGFQQQFFHYKLSNYRYILAQYEEKLFTVLLMIGRNQTGEVLFPVSEQHHNALLERKS